jgi:hypothetical protein
MDARKSAPTGCVPLLERMTMYALPGGSCVNVPIRSRLDALFNGEYANVPHNSNNREPWYFFIRIAEFHPSPYRIDTRQECSSKSFIDDHNRCRFLPVLF